MKHLLFCPLCHCNLVLFKSRGNWHTSQHLRKTNWEKSQRNIQIIQLTSSNWHIIPPQKWSSRVWPSLPKTQPGRSSELSHGHKAVTGSPAWNMDQKHAATHINGISCIKYQWMSYLVVIWTYWYFYRYHRYLSPVETSKFPDGFLRIQDDGDLDISVLHVVRFAATNCALLPRLQPPSSNIDGIRFCWENLPEKSCPHPNI